MAITWYGWRGRVNWGDLLTPLLLKHFCELESTWAPAEEAELAAVGSIIEHLPDNFAGTILGSGKLHEESRLPVGRGRILALRGPLTAHGVRGDFCLGDLGLLAHELVRIDTKKHKLCLVPHWSDSKLATRPEFTRYNPVVVNPRGDPLEAIRLIGESCKVVTSSLHGMIVADAFHIPRRLEFAPRLAAEGSVFKFKDHCGVVRPGQPFELGVTVEGNARVIERVQSELYDTIRSLR
jgi:pyruvyltransferase